MHGLISALPDSYDSDMGGQPYLLSAGQKQRIALARAIFASPRYLFLDEPNALLDAEGKRALGQTLSRLKRQGVTIVMTLQSVRCDGHRRQGDAAGKWAHGRFRDRAEVLSRMMANKHQIEVPLLESSLQDLTDWIAARFTRTSDAEFSQKAQLVGPELFNVACRNARKSEAQSAKFIFAFKDDTNCELKMVEEGASDAEAKMMRIRKMLKDPSVEMWKLPREEVSLATVDQLSARFEISNMENYALYAAALNMPNPEMARSNRIPRDILAPLYRAALAGIRATLAPLPHPAPSGRPIWCARGSSPAPTARRWKPGFCGWRARCSTMPPSCIAWGNRSIRPPPAGTDPANPARRTGRHSQRQ